MKILYSIQATGNGHISRAKELITYLKEYGEVDVFLSGDNSQLETNELNVKYRSKGLSFYYNSKGGLDYWKTLIRCNPVRIWKDVKALPVQEYDVILNDFEGITSLACRLRKVGSLGVGHQPSFLSNKVPKPGSKSFIGELVLRQLAISTLYMGFHFKNYDTFIYQPVIKKYITEVNPCDTGTVVVYLPHYSDNFLVKELQKLTPTIFKVFSKETHYSYWNNNVLVIPITDKWDQIGTFDIVMSCCHGVITGAGFETPAEAMYLGKKLMVIPIKGQYEQECNAEALKEMGVTVVKEIDDWFVTKVAHWLKKPNDVPKLQLKFTTKEIAHKIFLKGLKAREIGKIIN